jgi:pimeloyl-ACP methyl ester carboxylesterase
LFDGDALFDRDRSRRPSWLAFGREARALLSSRSTLPAPADLPQGAGLPVLVIPAFLTADGYTRRLRAFLGQCGFRAFGWELGRNWGPTPRVLAGLERRFDLLAARHGPVALVGISLGGLLARDLAHRRPGHVAHVVTVASPFRLPTASLLEPLVRLCARRYSNEIDIARLATPLPMPSTMLYTRDDGIVPPEDCWVDGAGCERIELRGPHLVLSGTAEAMSAIVRSLAPAGGRPA